MNIVFAPKPENDFAEFIRTYYDECRCRFDRIEAIAGKWMFRDLVPGMSDFDTRFVVADGMKPEDWCRMSMAVADAHMTLCRKVPSWARNLEHLPGINLTWQELTSEQSYYPEYQQWTYYLSTQPQRLSAALAHLAKRPWDIKDEYFHLKKFCAYYGRYDRTIDVPVNLGVHEGKYPLHSRLMHYFTPPVQSGACLLEKRPLSGKNEALEIAARAFPKLRCWPMIWEIQNAGYAIPAWYEESRLVELEDALEEALRVMADAIRPRLTLLPVGVGTDIPAWKKALAATAMDPALIITDNARFSRLMKGRLYFYAHAPACFDSLYLIRNELGRIGRLFFKVPFQVFWKLRTGETVEDPGVILDRLRGDPLTEEETECTREFWRLAGGTWEKGKERETALAIVAVYDGFFSALNRISGSAFALSAKKKTEF